MRLLTSSVIAPVEGISSWTAISRPHSIASGDSAEGDNPPDKQKGDANEATVERPLKLFAQERLDRLQGFRIRHNTINFDSSGPRSRGGKAEVVWATFKKGRLLSRTKEVAVKKLQYYRDLDKDVFSNKFLNEVEMMAKLSHKNIVRFVGFIEDLENGTAWIVMSWEPNGNVSEFLATGKWEIAERISLIQDTFEGLKYLHTRQPPICHGDLKSLNILVNSSYRAVITDFGSARVLRESGDRAKDEGGPRGAKGSPISSEEQGAQIRVISAGNQLTLTGPACSLRWAPPEVVNGNHPVLPSDIWSAGWVCWEIMTGKLPFSEVRSEVFIIQRVIEGKVPSAVEDKRLSQIARLCSLMTDCWVLDPGGRPNASRCYDEIKWVPSIPPLGADPSASKGGSRLLLQMGRMHYLQSRYKVAESLFKQGHDVASRESDQNASAAAVHWLGNASAALCKYTEAEESYAKARDLYTRIGEDSGLASTLEGLGNVYYLRSKFAEAEKSFSRSQEIYDSVGDKEGQANTLCGLGNVYRAQSKLPGAKKFYARAQDIYTRLGDGQGQANTLYGLGHIYRIQSNYVKAKTCFTRAQEICARIGDDLGGANALLGLGDLYRARSKYNGAKVSYTRAQEIYSRIGNERGRATTLYGLGEVYRLRSMYIEAESLLSQAQASYDRIGDGHGGANSLYGLGEIYRLQSKYAEAGKFYTRAKDIYTRVGDFQGQASTLYILGEIYNLQSEYAKAEDSFIQAKGFYSRTGDDQGVASTLHGLGTVYKAQSKSFSAEQAFARARDIYIRLGDHQVEQNSSVDWEGSSIVFNPSTPKPESFQPEQA